MGLFKNGEHGSTRSNSVLSSQNEDEDEDDEEDDDECDDTESHGDESMMNRSHSHSPSSLSRKVSTNNPFSEGSSLPHRDKIRPFSAIGSNLASIQNSPASLFMLPHSNAENENNLNENIFNGLHNFSSSLNHIKLLGRLYNDLRFNTSLVNSAAQPTPSAQSNFQNLANF